MKALEHHAFREENLLASCLIMIKESFALNIWFLEVNSYENADNTDVLIILTVKDHQLLS